VVLFIHRGLYLGEERLGPVIEEIRMRFKKSSIHITDFGA